MASSSPTLIALIIIKGKISNPNNPYFRINGRGLNNSIRIYFDAAKDRIFNIYEDFSSGFSGINFYNVGSVNFDVNVLLANM